jgi:integrase
VARIEAGGRRSEQSFADLASATQWRVAERSALRDGRRSDPQPTMREAATLFLVRAREGKALTRSRRRYAANTIEEYERVLRLHVLPRLQTRGRAPLGELTASELDTRSLQRLVDEISEDHGGELARHAYASLSAVLRDLYVRGIVDWLPPSVLLPPPNPRRGRALTPAEAEALLDAAAADDRTSGESLMYPLLALLLGSGMRIGELLALVWGPEGVDLDASPPRVVISRATTKTDAGARWIVLDPQTALILAQHHAAAPRAATGALVFARRDGERIERGGLVRSRLERIARAAGLEHVTPHVLRHTHATWGASAGVPITALAARLGHADPSFTLRRYAHAATSDTDAAAELILQHRRTATRRQQISGQAPDTDHKRHPEPPYDAASPASRPLLVMMGSGVRVPASALLRSPSTSPIATDRRPGREERKRTRGDIGATSPAAASCPRRSPGSSRPEASRAARRPPRGPSAATTSRGA